MNPGSILSDITNGMMVVGFPGLVNDLTFVTPGGVPILRVPNGTSDLVAEGNFRVVGPVTFPGLGAGFLQSNGLGLITSITAVAALGALLPAQAGNAGKVLTSDGTGASWQAAGGYSITANSAQFNPNDSTTYYFGIFASLPVTTTADTRRQYVPKAGTIRAAALNWFANSAAGSAESFAMYIRHNNTTDYLIASVATAAAQKLFINTALTIPVLAGDYIEIKLITPAWVNNPTQVNIGGSIFID